MLRRLFLGVLAAGLFLPAASVQAQFKQNDWVLTLSGTGNNDQDFRTGSASVSGSLGYFVTDQIDLTLRQTVVWGDGGSSWNGDTRVAGDYHFDLGNKFVPFVGANLGYQYGNDFEDGWIAGPEAGVDYFLNATTFIRVMASYEFDLQNGIDDGAFFYGLGLGVRF